MDHLRGLRNGGRGLGIPPPEKFGGRGQFPRGVIPPSRTMPVEEYSDMGSDMDESSDTEEDVFKGRYSIDSSPQDEDILRRKIPDTNSKYANQHYSSDGYSGYSEFSSSRETVRRQQLQQQRKPGISGYTEEQEEEDETDSGGSSEFVGKPGISRGVTVSSQGNCYQSESYSRKVSFREDVKVVAKEVCLCIDICFFNL